MPTSGRHDPFAEPPAKGRCLRIPAVPEPEWEERIRVEGGPRGEAELGLAAGIVYRRLTRWSRLLSSP
jgi:hypothetical protein